MRWTTKVLIQRVLSRTPGGRQLYYLGQRLGGQLRGLSAEAKVKAAVRYAELLASVGENLSGRRLLELGTGWVPVLPLVFWACGHESCETYDRVRLLRRRLLPTAARQVVDLARRADATALGRRLMKAGIDPNRVSALADRLEKGATAESILETVRVRYHAPADARQTELPAGSMDVVFSNLVLQHVRAELLPGLMSEAQRVLRPHGYMLHSIDLSDMYAHSDATIPPVHFLRYSEEAYAKYNTCFCHQNRWRASSYEKLFRDNGFEIVEWQARVCAESQAAVQNLALHDDYRSLTPEDICTTSVWVLARKKG
jgi:SAM-dependent methyltransferase